MVLVFITITFVAASAYFVYLHFSRSEKLFGWQMGIAGLWLLLILFLIVYGTVFIDFGMGVFVIGIFVIISTLISGVFLLILLESWRKLFGLLIGIVFPAIMLFTFIIAMDYSPSAVLRKNRLLLTDVIEQYKEDVGRYPESLDDLIPTYVIDLKGPNDQYGWLYVSTGEDFKFGRVSYIYRWGTHVCFVSSNNRDLECMMDSPELFDLGPTPGPTQYPPP